MGVIVALPDGRHRPADRRLGTDRRHQCPAGHGLGTRHHGRPAGPRQGRRAHPRRREPWAPPWRSRRSTGVAAVLGAWKSVFLRFHGGRGVATGVGGMLVVSPLVVPARRAGLLHHHRGDPLRLAGLAAGDRLRGRPGRPVRRSLARSIRPGCSTSCQAWPSSGSHIATTSGACWPARSAASTRDRQPRRRRGLKAPASAAACATRPDGAQLAAVSGAGRRQHDDRPRRGRARSAAARPGRHPCPGSARSGG